MNGTACGSGYVIVIEDGCLVLQSFKHHRLGPEEREMLRKTHNILTNKAQRVRSNVVFRDFSWFRWRREWVGNKDECLRKYAWVAFW
jgi:hypothetical protein